MKTKVIDWGYFVEKQEFKKKVKEHYKNEFNPAMLLKNKMMVDSEEEEDED